MNLAREIRVLADKYASDLITDSEMERLNGLLKEHPDQLEVFQRITMLHARLQWEFASVESSESVGAPADITSLTSLKSDAQTSNRSPSPISRWPVIFSIACSVLLLLVVFDLPGIFRGDAQAAVAIMSDSVGAEWEGPGDIKAGTELRPGQLKLLQGIAEVKFPSGTRAILKAPTHLELVSEEEVYLHRGEVVVHVAGIAGQWFRMETPTSQLLDIGTEYGVSVDPENASVLQVYDGEVLVASKLARAQGTQLPVESGQAIHLDEALTQAAFVPDRYVRELPTPDDPKGRGQRPYNLSRYRSLHIVPAPEVSIDGDLSDWDLSGRFRSHCDAPYDKNHYVEASLMYDEEYLYVGAHVGDPNPMRSRVSPYEERELFGGGGSIALRISTDREQGWPLRGVHHDYRDSQPVTSHDSNDKHCFVVLWYYRPEQKACLHLRYGLDYHGLQINPEGYRGAFQEDTDGLGYTIEYAIPWSLLHAGEDPPQAGDELGATWLVHWSDADGRKWRGQLIDVINPDEEGWNIHKAATWGKAIYHANGQLPLGTVQEEISVQHPR
ncbi:FecR protein [Calycomorphotria hydatis]|uniref:FecR protein n=2 Tax=Calycomorphotria hydatis TaxID=2528027 RepID=A0A517TAR5_9PLAN|nr:FecR protein [Calycomorphotria hydatis]